MARGEGFLFRMKNWFERSLPVAVHAGNGDHGIRGLEGAGLVQAASYRLLVSREL
jgi:hypothetical protein